MKSPNRFQYVSLIYVYTSMSVVLLAVPMFINFDSHHDGLILTTTLELRRAIETGGDWPFNQYGQLWALPFTLISFLVSDQYLLISIRLFTFAYYLASALLIQKVSSRYLSGIISRVPSLIFLLAQPFSLGLNSTFLPWPSALCSLLIIIVLERLTRQFPAQRNSDYAHFSAGFIVLGIIGTRFQVGLLLVLLIPILLLLHLKTRETWVFLTGFFASLIIVESLFYSQGWLGDSLYDSIVFSSQYVSGDTSTYPFPKVTFILSAFFLMAIVITVSFVTKRRESARISIKSVTVIIIGLLILTLIASLFSELEFITWMTLLIRRLWISISISILIYSMILLAPQLKRKTILSEFAYLRNLLMLFSCCSFTQIAPLFDQMHFWWGFSPLVILIVVFGNDYFFQGEALRGVFKPIFVIFGAILLLVNIFGVVNQVRSSTTSIDSSIAVGVLTADSTDNEISNFLNTNIRSGSSVLNLCPNSNVFFSVKSSFSSIRQFVLWSPTFDFSAYKKNFVGAKYDYIVACPLNHPGDSGQIKVNNSIQEIVSKSRLPIYRSFVDSHGRTWAIYKFSE